MNLLEHTDRHDFDINFHYFRSIIFHIYFLSISKKICYINATILDYADSLIYGRLYIHDI